LLGCLLLKLDSNKLPLATSVDWDKTVTYMVNCAHIDHSMQSDKRPTAAVVPAQPVVHKNVLCLNCQFSKKAVKTLDAVQQRRSGGQGQEVVAGALACNGPQLELPPPLPLPACCPSTALDAMRWRAPGT
jgi:hypothetical protein